jgi:hypothetical protein
MRVLAHMVPRSFSKAATDGVGTPTKAGEPPAAGAAVQLHGFGGGNLVYST